MRTRTLIAGGCVAAFLFAAQPASAVVVLRVVDDDGQATPFDCNAGAAASAHTTITAAVTASSAGDFIKVCPGTYNEQVVVNKALTLLGAQAGVDARGRSGAAGTESIVRGAGTPRTTPFNVTASNVTIDGFTVQDQTDTNNLGFGIFLTAGLAGEIVRNNIVQNNIAGLALGSDNTTIQHNVFRNNNQPGPISGTGIYTDQFQAGGTLSNVTIAANEFSGNQNVGVLLGSTTAASPANTVDVTQNTFTTNGNAFLAFNWVFGDFFRNTVTGSIGSQVLLGGGVNNATLTENTISGGSVRGIRVGDFGGGATNSLVTARCNSITGNGGAGLEIDAAAGAFTGTLVATFNWWGSPTGPTIASNPGGTGQSIVDPGGQVAFNPFLTNGVDSDPATPGFQCVPRASAADATIPEGDSGTATVDIPVTLDNPSPSTVTIAFETQDGTATTGSDYTATSGTLTFNAGQQSKVVSVPVSGDTGLEPDETFTVKLSAPANATIADDAGTVTITNDDPQPADLTAPLASGLRLRPSGFKPRTGTTISYSLSEAATTKFTVARVLPGRVKGGKCRRESSSNRTGRRCKLFKRVRGSFTHQGAAGANSLRFNGRVRGRTLRPGRYRLSAAPKDAAGNVGRTARASFRVKR